MHWKRLLLFLAIIIAALALALFYWQQGTPMIKADIERPVVINKGELIYSNPLSQVSDISDWRMEGPGKIEFSQGWMEMFSPNEEFHHVFWAPVELPESFIAQWQVQNLHTERGLAIVIFAARGENYEDIFSEQVKPRDGTFTQYIFGDINTYHISYYANADDAPDRGHANLRKNWGFDLVQVGQEGIETQSSTVHQIKLIKDKQRIILFVDNRKVIDWLDSGEYLQGGKLGFRQMKWTRFRYNNLKVWAIN